MFHSVHQLSRREASIKLTHIKYRICNQDFHIAIASQKGLHGGGAYDCAIPDCDITVSGRRTYHNRWGLSQPARQRIMGLGYDNQRIILRYVISAEDLQYSISMMKGFIEIGGNAISQST